MEIPVVHIELIDGKPFIKGRKVKVRMIAQMYIEGGSSIQDLMERYNLTAAEVHTALAYYYDHQEFFEQEQRAIQPVLDAAKKASQERLERMQKRMRKIRGEE